jgi:hypothetical protein
MPTVGWSPAEEKRGKRVAQAGDGADGKNDGSCEGCGGEVAAIAEAVED